MKKDFDQKEFDHLIASKQFFPAVWRLIDATPIGVMDADTVGKVSEVVRMATKQNCVEQVAKIMRQFSKWVDHDVSAAAHTLLNETTAVDLQPDEL